MKRTLLSLSLIAILVGCTNTTPTTQRLCQTEAIAYQEYNRLVDQGYVPDETEIARMVDLALRLVFNCDWTPAMTQQMNARSAVFRAVVFERGDRAVKTPVDKFGVPIVVE